MISFFNYKHLNYNRWTCEGKIICKVKEIIDLKKKNIIDLLFSYSIKIKVDKYVKLKPPKMNL